MLLNVNVTKQTRLTKAPMRIPKVWIGEDKQRSERSSVPIIGSLHSRGATPPIWPSIQLSVREFQKLYMLLIEAHTIS
jgi:hypothetical protein